MSQIRLPLGMRDLVFEEARKKRQLQERIETIFHSYGYQEVIAPTIEFLETYQKAFSSLKDQQMYKFFDAAGNTLALRMDMTVPIARICASKYKDEEGPFRFCYCANVFKVRESFAGKRSEVTDCGVELIGLDEQSDLEVISCALDTMKSFGIADYTLEIGNSSFFKKACILLNLSNDVAEKLAQLVDQKSMVDLKEYLVSLDLSQKQEEFFLKLPLLNGKNVLKDALTISFDDSLKAIVQKLQDLKENLKALGYEDNITFDLGKVPHLDYYTGILFEGYVHGVGTSVLSGGRYDHLLSIFGKDLPAVGFSIKLDYLLDVIDQKPEKILYLYYPVERQIEAFEKARELRKEQRVKLIPYNGENIMIQEGTQ
ncbi:ATP phosphoribosyltransferase regulatory subunit [uncultured Faecalicoccus sp.]|uniref:ATP phosphoribosyltransferase regulatory subunit n=1 Tax=uncultured Faecalicoccus sp. TaxID=1971760 RepID=UPI002605FFE9|nr:ATP phosphoribosyltransferase regulatory subunit [uncultured Faecalicoccus sp.]